MKHLKDVADHPGLNLKKKKKKKKFNDLFH